MPGEYLDRSHMPGLTSRMQSTTPTSPTCTNANRGHSAARGIDPAALLRLQRMSDGLYGFSGVEEQLDGKGDGGMCSQVSICPSLEPSLEDHAALDGRDAAPDVLSSPGHLLPMNHILLGSSSMSAQEQQPPPQVSAPLGLFPPPWVFSNLAERQLPKYYVVTCGKKVGIFASW